MQTYELMVVYKPILFEDVKKNSIVKLEKLVKKLQGSMQEVENLGKRLLAYEMRTPNGQKFSEGHYVQYNLTITPNELGTFQKEIGMLPDVLRFIVISKD